MLMYNRLEVFKFVVIFLPIADIAGHPLVEELVVEQQEVRVKITPCIVAIPQREGVTDKKKVISFGGGQAKNIDRTRVIGFL